MAGENKEIEIAPKGRFQQALERLRPFVKEKVVGAGQAVAAAARAADVWMLEKGIHPLAATAEEWRKIRGMNEETSTLVTRYQTAASLDEKREAARTLAGLAEQHKTDWSRAARSAARKALRYMGEETEEARKEKSTAPTPQPTERQEQPGGTEEAPAGAEANIVIETASQIGRRIKVHHYDETDYEVYKGLEQDPHTGEYKPKREMERRRVPVYTTEDGKPLTFDDITAVLRDYLDEVILGNRFIRDASLEHQASYGLVWAANNLAISVERDKKTTNKEKMVARQQAENIRMEYESIRNALNWWHLAARDAEGGFSKGANTYSNGIAWGSKYGGQYIYWLLTNKDRGPSFIKGLFTPRERLSNTDFKNASEFLGAMLRESCGVGTKDEVDPKTGQRKPPERAGTEFVDTQGNKRLVVNGKEEVSDRTKGTNSREYETHKQISMDAYALRQYLETRYHYMDLIYEYSHRDEKTGRPIFISHISADRLWVYDVFQQPKYMGPFWYANLDVLDSDGANSKELVDRLQNGRRFLEQLGWMNLDPDPIKNRVLNKLLLGTGKNFFSSHLFETDEFLNETFFANIGLHWGASGKGQSEVHRQRHRSRRFDELCGLLCSKFGIDWDKKWDEGKKKYARRKLRQAVRRELVNKYGGKTGRKIDFSESALIDWGDKWDTRLRQILLGEGEMKNWARARNLKGDQFELLSQLGIIRLFGGEEGRGPYGMEIPYIITTNLINLNTEEIPEEIGQKLNWKSLQSIEAFLSDWAQQQVYIQKTRNQLIEILLGSDKMSEALKFIGSGEGWRHLTDPLAPIAQKERDWWYEVIHLMELRSLLRYKEGGNRHNLAKMIRGLIPQGFLRAPMRRLWFTAEGIQNMDWSDNIGMIETYQKIRQFLQGMNEVKVVRDGLDLAGKKLTYEDLYKYAGLEIKPFYKDPTGSGEDLLYHYDLIHMLSDEKGWDIEENIQTLRLLREFIDDYSRHFDESQEPLGLGGDKIKEKWVKERPEDAQKILGIFEEWETEVDLPLMRNFLNEFLGRPFFDLPTTTRQQKEINRGARRRWIAHWIRTHPEKEVEKIFQVWPEFVETDKETWETWKQSHKIECDRVEHMVVDYPGRYAWTWGRAEAGTGGQAAPGAELLEMLQWSVAEKYKGNSFEEDWAKWDWRRYGPRFNLWTREKGLYRVIRRQKASMDLRYPEQKKWIKIGDTIQQHPNDVIIGKWFYDQLEWNPVPHEGDLNRHDREDEYVRVNGELVPHPFRGLDRLKCLLMVTGEYYPGDPREVSPLWYGHSIKRLLYRFASRYSYGYHIEHAKLAAKVNDYSDWKDYWREHMVSRLVAAPSKWYKILRLLSITGTMDPDEHVPFMRAFGCTKKETIQYWGERRGLRFPDEEDVVKGEQASETKQYLSAIGAEIKAFPGTEIVMPFLTAGRTATELAYIARNAAVGGAIGTIGLNTAVVLLSGGTAGLGAGMIITGAAGVLGGAMAGLDRGDLVGGISYYAGRFFGLLGQRIERSDPEALALGYTPLRILGRRLPYRLERALSNFFPPPANDDIQSAQDTAQALQLSKAELGGEGLKQ